MDIVSDLFFFSFKALYVVDGMAAIFLHFGSQVRDRYYWQDDEELKTLLKRGHGGMIAFEINMPLKRRKAPLSEQKNRDNVGETV